MEIRHLRYFVAVAEAGSLTVAAERALHTSQPSLGRQLSDLEAEVGAALMRRHARGVELTAAGRLFLEHARAMLGQIDVAIDATRRFASSARPSLVVGFLTGHETTWLPAALAIVRDALPDTHVVLSSQVSPQLAVAVTQGLVDVAFLRREAATTDVVFDTLVHEALEVFMPRHHRLCMHDAIDPAALVDETFLAISGRALHRNGHPPALRTVVDDYLRRAGLRIEASHEVDNLAGMMSLIESTGGVALLPVYASHLATGGVTSRPLIAPVPAIELCLGYRADNESPALRAFVAQSGALKARVAAMSGEARRRRKAPRPRRPARRPQ